MNQSSEVSGIRAILQTGRIPIGIQCFLGIPPVVEIAGRAGFDFVMLDTEHSPVSARQLENLIRAAETVQILPLVRVAGNHPWLIRSALEAGAKGVIVPQVRGVEDVKLALDAARYPPLGSRGMCPATRAAAYSVSDWDHHAREANTTLPVIPLLEHPDAIESAAAICDLEGVEIVMFGPGDLGIAMGLGGSGLLNPAVQEAFDHVLSVAQRSGTLVIGVPYPDLSANACQELIDRGASILLHSADALLFSDLCRQIIAELTPTLTMGLGTLR